jgi:cysteine desulfurase family protein (TIGR01976 family)
MTDIPFDVDYCRAQFPALARQQDGRPVVFFDGPAGSQTPRRVIDAVAHYLAHTNANTHGEFATSRASDELLAEAHRGVADFLGADDPDCVIFGANMTTLTLALSRAIGRTWRPGDEVLVTRSDHDGNVTPWVLAARDAGAVVHHVNVRRDDCTLDLDDLRRKLSSRTRLVAVGAASNATGTVHPVRTICDWAHQGGAEVFVDAVHYAPHRLIDVTALGCDYLAVSAYKFFGPHLGVLWGRGDRLAALPAYKLRPAPDSLPGRWETGTQSHEAIAGTLAAVEYLADLGQRCANAAESLRDSPSRPPEARPRGSINRRAALVAAYRWIEQYERQLLSRLLEGLRELPEINVHGITDLARLAERVSTICFTHGRLAPVEVAQRLAADGIYVWHGNYYALPLTETLGLEPDGAVRVGLLHYNTPQEVDRLLAALEAL